MNTELTTEDVEKEMQKCSKCSLDTGEIDVCDVHQQRLQEATPSTFPTEDIQELDELRKQSYGSSTGEKVQALAFLGLVVAGSGLAGVYASRFFSGWAAQVAGGGLVALLTLSVLFGALATISKYTGGGGVH